ncbi:MAG TPA: phage terminase large subunit [bacterium]|nr:phage terminase large subunit [bacterium]HQP99653.1 phage terminase large subunit [bacterium]
MRTTERSTTKDLVSRWLDSHRDEIGMVQFRVSQLAKEIKRTQVMIGRVIKDLKDNGRIVEYTLERDQRLIRIRMQRPAQNGETDREESLQARIHEFEQITGYDALLLPLIQQFAATEQTIADIDRELRQNGLEPKERDVLRRNLKQQKEILVRFWKEIEQHAVPKIKEQTNGIPLRWLSDSVTFAREALGVTLHPHQVEFCNAPHRVVIMIAGRGAGKSMAARIFALYTACRKPNHTVLVVSSGMRMCSEFSQGMLDLLNSSELKKFMSESDSKQIVFQNKSRILFLPANPDTIRGYHPSKTAETAGGLSVILDEACYMEHGEEIRTAVEYAMITTEKDQGRMAIVSSPSSVHSWVYPLFQDGQEKREDIISFQWPSTVNPDIREEEVERLRRSRTDLEFRAEVMAEWVEGSHGLFAGLVDPAILPYAIREIRDGEIATLGADLALSYDDSHDASALLVLARTAVAAETGEDLPWPYVQSEEETPFRYRVVDLVRLTRADTNEVQREARRLAEMYGITHAAVEQYQGKSLADYLTGLGIQTELIAPTAVAQQNIFNALYNLFRRREIEIPQDVSEILISELKAFQYRREATGRFSFGHPEGSKTVHDDTVYALAWALQAQFNLAGVALSPPPEIAFF